MIRRLLGIVAVTSALAACAAPGSTSTAPPTAANTMSRPTSGSTSAPTTRASTPPSAAPQPSGVAVGPVWPIEPRTIAASPSRGGLPVLKAIKAGRHGSYERVVLEFTASYGEVKVRYVPVVHQDPSDKVVPLRGSSFLEVVVQGAVATWEATPITPYTGPSTVKTGFPTVKQVSISGDFEAVLSFGVGLGRTAGFRVARLRSPDRLVLDVAERPPWRMWPDDSLSMARVEQTAFDQGHAPWRGSAELVATAYARAVYGWSDPVVTRAAGIDTYRLAHARSSDHVTVRAVRMFATSRNTIFEIGDTR
ncbi:AMIN-like domain-containing (lipo)protein [Pedococcus sp. 5OH_020]|uniref:AMIN-like domain-containing (lipo)protein n=1 Tax=Pedococcus sp. 5OH_020 TaxID=2989814 RepID=UPI0022E9DF75|nr:hypothetical protein [Pedococcus sp. 5OH_020]